jgi:hypothetical protein
MKIHQALIVSFLSISSLMLLAPIFSQAEAGISHNEKQSLIAAANKDDTIKYGEFKSVKARTSGDVEIFRAGNGRLFIEFDNDFRTEEGPDLFVVLSRSSEVTDGDNNGEPFFTVSPLLRLRGEQKYILPGNFDPSQYNSIAIWCRQMNVVLGSATLTAK